MRRAGGTCGGTGRREKGTDADEDRRRIGFDPTSIAEQAAEAEASGLRRRVVGRDQPRPVPAHRLGAAATERLEFGTGIAVAFARNPMTLAVVANDLQLLTKGRFLLGMGCQIKPHITKRFSMPWSHPAPRMRELILAIRAIWKTWETGEPLDFRGDFYTHTLMTPFFDPGPNPYGNPKILLAGVGQHMTEVAGEVADGFLVHAFTTERYLREVSLPALERGAAKAGKTRDDLDGVVPGLRRHRRGRREHRGRRPGACASRSPSTAPRRPTARCSSCTAGATSSPSSTRCPSAASG